MGKPSGGLVDVDIDDTTALRFAPSFLPETNCIFGRPSKPRSHWIYRVPEPGTHQQFQANGMIVEVRGNNRCTVFPGSVHESGESIEFEDRNNFEPSSSSWNDLVRAAGRIAIATKLFEAWNTNQRHDLALATAAKLARLKWSRDEVRHLIEAVATEADDEEVPDRLIAVDTTFEAYDQRHPITEEEHFNELLGQEIADIIHRRATPSADPTKPGAPHRSAITKGRV
jgi:hypothetical protein